ncbi:sugar transferase [Armatimonas sp.]|uniref:sugar transferase n=1 Tax=Armatimonas sp. TaxID=1872638 RepID=UPI00375073EA
MVKSSTLREIPLQGERQLSEPLRRALDIAVAATALTVLAPVLATVALLVWSEDRGSILFHQERVGQNGKRFAFYKFRSMVANAEALKESLSTKNEASGPIFKMQHDPRITRIGRVLRRYSLDELPQLWNVLKGDMSLVGPRPHLPREIESYPNYPLERLSVPPGLICLREVSGRSRLTFEEWIALDLEYVRKRSLLLNLSILLRALPAVLRGDGAY